MTTLVGLEVSRDATEGIIACTGPDQLLSYGKMSVMIAAAPEVKNEIPNDASA